MKGEGTQQLNAGPYVPNDCRKAVEVETRGLLQEVAE